MCGVVVKTTHEVKNMNRVNHFQRELRLYDGGDVRWYLCLHFLNAAARCFLKFSFFCIILIATTSKSALQPLRLFLSLFCSLKYV